MVGLGVTPCPMVGPIRKMDVCLTHGAKQFLLT
jgi:hypothetical protein